jgi:hypothetical protein
VLLGVLTYDKIKFRESMVPFSSESFVAPFSV